MAGRRALRRGERGPLPGRVFGFHDPMSLAGMFLAAVTEWFGGEGAPGAGAPRYETAKRRKPRAPGRPAPLERGEGARGGP